MTLHATRDRQRGTVTVSVAYGPVRVQVEEFESYALSFWHELGRVVAAEDNEDRARKGYQRYVAHCGGKSVHGEPLPSWEEQQEEIREHWIAAFTE